MREAERDGAKAGNAKPAAWWEEKEADPKSS
jgi:hypothetical protein